MSHRFYPRYDKRKLLHVNFTLARRQFA